MNPDNVKLSIIRCAAMTNGCQSILVGESSRINSLLVYNNWRLDHGKWVCPNYHTKARDMILYPERMKVYKNRTTGKWVSYCPVHYQAQNRPTQLSALSAALFHVKWFHPPVGVVEGVNPKNESGKKNLSKDDNDRTSSVSRFIQGSSSIWHRRGTFYD